MFVSLNATNPFFSWGFSLTISFLKKIVKRKKKGLSYGKKFAAILCYFIIGGIGGAFGGQGVLLVYTLTSFFGMNFIVAAGTRVIVSFFITTISLIIYSNAGAVHWQYGIILAIASLFGTYFGAIYSITYSVPNCRDLV